MGMNATDLSNLRILIVDDETDALNALADIFEDHHCTVTRAASGAEGRAAFQTQQFEVALLSIRLPDARGTDLLREIREASDFTRCIMITASSDAEDAINALNKGASAYIQKPIDFDEMKRTILSVVDKYLQSADGRRKLRDLDIIRGIGEAAMDLDLQRMLANVLERTVVGFGADAGVVLRYEEDAQILRGNVQYRFSDQPLEDYVVRLGEGIAGRVASELRVMEVETVPDCGYAVPLFVQRAGIVSILGAPIIAAQGLLGVLLIGWRSPRAFTADDMNLLRLIAQRAGLACSNAELYALEDKSKRRAEYLARVSQELNSQIEDVHEVVDRVTRLATERLGDGCAIFLLRPGRETLETMLSFHRDPAKQRLIERYLRDNPVSLGEGIIGRVALTHEAVLANVDELRAAYPHRHYLEDAGIVSSLAIPLRAHGSVFGVMSCSVSQPGVPHDANQLALATEFAARAAVAIENAILLHEAQSKRAEVQALFALTRAVSSTLEEPQVLEFILRGTAQLMDVPACCIATGDASHKLSCVNRELGMSHDDAERMVAALLRAWPDTMLSSSEPFLVADLRACNNAEVVAAAKTLRFASLMSVALGVDAAHDTLLIVLTRERDDTLITKCELLATLGGLAGVALANARSYNREFMIAERVQQWILSTEFGEARQSEVEGIEIATGYHAALVEASVGGDFYDIFPVAGGRIGLVIGDVSGKGLDAALQTQAAKHTLRAYALDTLSPAEVLKRTNHALCQMLPADVFITLFYGILDRSDVSLMWCNAGHDAPMVCSENAPMTGLESSGPALGLMPDAEYAEECLLLHPGDLLFLYTDGLSEARYRDVFLETKGVAEIVSRHAALSARDIVRRVYEDVRAFAAGHLHDDIALLALKVNGDFKDGS